MIKANAKLAAALGDGLRSDSFEEFLQFARDMKQQHRGAPPDVLRFVRFVELFSVAAVEGATQMTGKNPTPEFAVEVMRQMALGSSVAISSAVLSVMRPETPAALFREFMAQQFTAGIDEVIRINGFK